MCAKAVCKKLANTLTTPPEAKECARQPLAGQRDQTSSNDVFSDLLSDFCSSEKQRTVAFTPLREVVELTYEARNFLQDL